MTSEETNTVLQAVVILNGIGFFGGVIAAWKASLNMAMTYKDIQNKLNLIEKTLSEVRESQKKNERDINHAHNKIREEKLGIRF